MSDREHGAAPPVLPAPALSQPETEHEGRIGYGRYARYSPLGLALVLLVAVIAVWWWRSGESGGNPGTNSFSGRPVPDVTLTTFQGNTVRLLDLKDSVVVVNFWAEWCAPCREEMPAFEDVFQQVAITGEPVVILGVNLKSDRQENALKLLDELDITYINGPDTGGGDPLHGPIQLAFGIPESYPATIFIRPDGTIDTVRIGAMKADEIRERIKHAGG